MRGEAAIGDEDAVRRHGAVELAHEPRHADGHLVGRVALGHFRAPRRHAPRDLRRVFRLARGDARRVVGERRMERAQRLARIAPERELRRGGAAELLGDVCRYG